MMTPLDSTAAPDDEPPAGDPLRRLLEDIMVEAHLDDLDLPHVVVCGTSTGIQVLTGPFPTALAALEAAAEEERRERLQDPDTDLRFGVRALNPVPCEWLRPSEPAPMRRSLVLSQSLLILAQLRLFLRRLDRR
jgi:hypothetical protein